jgi:glucose/arabinose dehydrogenase
MRDAVTLARRSSCVLSGLLFVALSGHLLAQQAPGKAPAKQPPVEQGTRAAEFEGSKLAPHPPKMTVTAPSEIPLDRLRVPAGFRVELWAHGMPGVRMMTRGDKGTIYAGTRVIGRVYEIKDTGKERTSRVLAEGLTQPNGVAFRNGALYVGVIDKMYRYDGIEDNPNVKPVDLSDQFKLPPLLHHNWKFLAFGPDGKLYVPIGAPCNICEPTPEYAQIRRYNPDGSGMEVVARGVRNTVGFDFHPRTRELWFTDNGRDWQAENGPEDELNRLSKVGENFGFPYCHANGIQDRDYPKADGCKGVTLPVTLLGPHTGSLGMRFYTGNMFPGEYKEAIFVARRGSWNRTRKAGYDVVVVRAGADGKGAKVTPFLTGFLDEKTNEFWGRPVDVLQMPDGSLLVSDEQNGAIYRVSHGGGKK